MSRHTILRRALLTAVLAVAAAIGTAGCVLVPVGPPGPGPAVVVPAPPVVVAPYGYYGWGYGRWHRW